MSTLLRDCSQENHNGLDLSKYYINLKKVQTEEQINFLCIDINHLSNLQRKEKTGKDPCQQNCSDASRIAAEISHMSQHPSNKYQLATPEFKKEVSYE